MRYIDPVPVRLISDDTPLPPAEEADARGLVAVGGDLRAERLLDAYRRGIFPWYEEGLPILWHSPDPRMVLFVDELEVNRSLRKRLRKGGYEVRFDENFERVIGACAAVPRPGQDGTWITAEMIEAYCELHRLGFAHSVETYVHGELVGGLYGVNVGGVFCGESMFAHAPDASKIAFIWGVRQLERWGVEIVDCQVYTDHLARFGAYEIRRRDFLKLLRRLSHMPTRRGAWAFDPGADWERRIELGTAELPTKKADDGASAKPAV